MTSKTADYRGSIDHQWVELIPPKRNSFAGVGAMAAGCAFGAVALGVAVTQSSDILLLPFSVLLPLLFGLFLLCVGYIVYAPKGGLYLDRVSGVLHWRNPAGACLAVPLAQVRALKVHIRSEQWGEAAKVLASLEVRLRSGVHVILGESEFREVIGDLETEVREVLSPLLKQHQEEMVDGGGDTMESVQPANNTVVRVGAGGVYCWSLCLFGLACTAGGFLFVQGIDQSLLAILFGPVLIFLGLAVLGVYLARLVASEVVDCSPERLEHCYQLGPLKWGRSSAPTPLRLRVRVRGVQGLCLEAVGEKTVVMLNGVSDSTRIKPGVLLQLANQYLGRISQPGQAGTKPATMS